MKTLGGMKIMGAYPTIAWVMLLLTCVVACVGLTPRFRRNCRWGRAGTSIPMTAVGAVMVTVALGAMTATTFGLLPLVTLFVSFVLVLAAALHDSWRDGKANRRNDKG